MATKSWFSGYDALVVEAWENVLEPKDEHNLAIDALDPGGEDETPFYAWRYAAVPIEISTGNSAGKSRPRKSH